MLDLNGTDLITLWKPGQYSCEFIQDALGVRTITNLWMCNDEFDIFGNGEVSG